MSGKKNRTSETALTAPSSPPSNLPINGFKIPLFYLDLNGCLSHYNAAFETFAKQHLNVAIKPGFPAVKFFQKNIRAEWEAFLKISDPSEPARIDMEVSPDLWIEIMTGICMNPGLERSFLIHDISQQKLEKRKLQEALNKETEQNQIKTKFIRVATHQFKTPLTVIKSNVELISGTATRKNPDDEKFRDSILMFKKRIYKEIDRLVFLMDDMLQSEKLSEEIETKLDLNDLKEVCDELVRNFNTLKPGGHQLEYSISGAPRKIRFNIELVQHALFNLIDNAFKYSKVDPKLTLIFDEHKTRVIVEDNGIGIPSKDMNKLFSPFFRSGNTKGISGTGLGLNIAYQYLKKNKAEIDVESEENVGTKFIVTFNN